MNQAIDAVTNNSIDLSSSLETSLTESVTLAAGAEVAVETVSITGRSGTLPAHLLTSGGATTASPAIIVVHDATGPDEWIQQAGSRLASVGFTMLLPNLFANSAAPADDGEVAQQDFLLSLSDTRIVSDLLAVVDWLSARGHIQIGIIGWGWGGAYALMAAAHDTRLRAVVDVAGTISYPVSTPNRVGSPLNFVADLEGALLAAYPGADPQFAANEIERLRGRLVEHDKNGEVKVYPDAPPRFWHDERSPHTLLLWRRITDFLQENLIDADDEHPAFGEGYPNEESRLHA
ncbi:MAG: carboxymethylenebutenolidase [Abditibacteriota bacterium]|nr:carboxymethylenebutenolidase [Abditibacteriota bacterium]